MRFNLFQLMQATARAEGLGVAAKGVTGRGYEGHYFWDTEIYVVPFLTHTSPRWARQVLDFRVGMLDAARTRAREVGHRGALYPWRTINGEEASAWYAAGTAQYHINADIAYAFRHYAWVSGDLDFLLGDGAQALVETARLWMELGFFSDGALLHQRRDRPRRVHDGRRQQRVHEPDGEGEPRGRRARDAVAARRGPAPPTRSWSLATGLTDEEIDGWLRAADAMYLPRHEGGIVLQDDGFLERKRWDFEGTPATSTRCCCTSTRSSSTATR